MIPATLLPALLLAASNVATAQNQWVYLELCRVNLEPKADPVSSKAHGLWLHAGSVTFIGRAGNIETEEVCSYVGVGALQFRVKGNPAWVKKQMEGYP